MISYALKLCLIYGASEALSVSPRGRQNRRVTSSPRRNTIEDGKNGKYPEPIPKEDTSSHLPSQDTPKTVEEPKKKKPILLILGIVVLAIVLMAGVAFGTLYFSGYYEKKAELAAMEDDPSLFFSAEGEAADVGDADYLNLPASGTSAPIEETSAAPAAAEPAATS